MRKRRVGRQRVVFEQADAMLEQADIGLLSDEELSQAIEISKVSVWLLCSLKWVLLAASSQGQAWCQG